MREMGLEMRGIRRMSFRIYNSSYLTYCSRHLIRLWLRNEELAWQLPEELKPLWTKTFDVEPNEQTFALEPVVREAAKGRL